MRWAWPTNVIISCQTKCSSLSEKIKDKNKNGLQLLEIFYEITGKQGENICEKFVLWPKNWLTIQHKAYLKVGERVHVHSAVFSAHRQNLTIWRYSRAVDYSRGLYGTQTLIGLLWLRQPINIIDI